MPGSATNIVIAGAGSAANLSVVGAGSAANFTIASPVSTFAPSLVTAPVLSGSAEVGNAISCSEGTWEGNPAPGCAGNADPGGPERVTENPALGALVLVDPAPGRANKSQ